MSLEQEHHLHETLTWFQNLTDTKYRKGQQEHGGNMWEKPGMLYCLIDEAVDHVVYLKTIADQIQAKAPELYAYLMSPGEDDR